MAFGETLRFLASKVPWPSTFSSPLAGGTPLTSMEHALVYLGGSLVLAAKIGAVMTVTVLVQHFSMEFLADRGALHRTAGVKRVPLRLYDVIRYFFNMSVTFLVFSFHVNVAWAYSVPEQWRPGFSRVPTLLELFLYSLLVLALADCSFYFLHRAMHHFEHRNWFGLLHTPHHDHVHLAKGMMASDLMALNPIEAWFNVMPGYHASYLVMCMLSEPNVYAAVFGFWVPIMTSNLGHCGYNINLPWLVKHVMGVNPVYIHAFHHKNSKKNFSMFFCWWDKICGTYYDYHEAAQKELMQS